jgi:hypothetical protein
MPLSSLLLLVIVHDLNFVSVALSPHEAKTPLIVDPNTMLAFSAAMQCFQAIAGRSGQIAQFGGAVQLPELSPGDPLDGLKAAARLPTVKSPGFGAAERLDHDLSVYCLAFNVKQETAT